MVDASLGTCFAARPRRPLLKPSPNRSWCNRHSDAQLDGTDAKKPCGLSHCDAAPANHRANAAVETPCAAVRPWLIASVQRPDRAWLLQRRRGRVNGRTATLVEQFQTAQGDVQTSTLTLQTARPWPHYLIRDTPSAQPSSRKKYH
jgi:hypothetical protein